MMDSKPKYKLTDKDFNQTNRRLLFGFQLGWSYERTQNAGYLFLILPQLRKIYGDNTPELQEMMKTHIQFFNTSSFFDTIITGIDLAIEGNGGVEGKDTVTGLKVGLMGPLAAIGDSIFAALILITFDALTAFVASQGNPVGVFIWITVQVAICFFRQKQLRLAYDKGVTLATEMRDRLNASTDTAAVLDVFMVGALVAAMVNVKFAWVSQIGKVTMDIQNNLDIIIPRLLPALIVGFVYWLLGKKKMTSTKVILIVLILSVALGGIGVLAKI